jgi:periplasmic copper chaperone A
VESVIRRLGGSVAALALLAACGDDDDIVSADGIRVADAWARSTPAGVTTGAVYLTLTSEEADTLVGATVANGVAAAAELHQSLTSPTGVTMMQPVDSVDLSAGDPLVFEPGGSHIMLVDLAGPLERGDTVPLTLHFGRAAILPISVEVRDEPP